MSYVSGRPRRPAREGAASEAGDSANRRREVLRTLRISREPLTIVAIADVLGVHPNTVRFHLDSLVGDGQVEQVGPGRKGPGRPPLMFRAVRQMDRGGTRHYEVLAEILAVALAGEKDSAAKALAVGRAWGRRLDSGAAPERAESPEQAIGRLVGLLDRLGFAPERRSADGAQQVGLRHCPFLEIAENRSGVVCPVHLGLMQGALEGWGAAVTVERLDAFVEPDLCLAHLELQESPR
ncbi:helix-turn-helix transcriptional regulator [Mycobacterium tilburgii]|uniref:helix-turn-helix transcriptional regulator n=1 Tax=Mycobacterium tilburgii TaxID=44467 RepID=UPI0011834283|nr:helix-turn-helix domain-containing protein [Mycobacterium tilburgii]